MTKSDLNPFVGLKPYSENESEFYFGREQEVENLLHVLQKNKLLTLSGDSGAGKTSLIKAGLIPRLKNGFTGQAGKDWSIAYFRPGIDPLSNLAHALTFNDVLNIDNKPNTTDNKYYSEIISNYKALGIVEIYKRSEIYNTKNLLIVIDQLEDLFRFEQYFDTTLTEDDNNLMDMIYRSVTFKNTAIYFIICIEGAYLTKLTPYNKLQEIISQSQYSIQNLDYVGINQILEQTFYKHDIYFDSKVVESFIETLNEKISYLPNFQFLLQKLYEKHVINGVEKQHIDIDDIKELGGINSALSSDFETIYEGLDKTDKNKMSLLFKGLKDAQNSSIDSNYNKILNISEYINISVAELSSTVRDLKYKFNDLIEIFEPSISGIPISEKKPFDSNNIINLKYTKFLNWERRSEWLAEEENDYQDFKSFSDDAIKKNNGEVDFLKTPELESAIAWRDNPNHTLNWSKRYRLNFKETIAFINESEQDDLRIKKEKADQLERERKNERTKRKWYSIGGGICLIMACIAFYNGRIADENADLAEESAVVAKIAKDDADKKAEEAKIAKIKADESAVLANEAEQKAKRNQKKATIQRNKAESALAELKIAKRQDSIRKLEIEKTVEELGISNKFAKNEADKNKTISELLEIKSNFKKLTSELNDAFQDKDKARITKLINRSLNSQKTFDSLRSKENIDIYIGDENVLDLNQKTLSVLEEQSKYSQTSMRLAKSDNFSIRSFSVLDDAFIAYAGDKGEVHFYDIKKEEKREGSVPIAQNNIDDRIRDLVFASEDLLLVTTFSGKILKVYPKTLTFETLYESETATDLIVDFFINNSTNSQYLVLKNKIITFKDYRIQNQNNNFKNIQASYYLDSKLFLVADDNLFVLDGDGKNYKILLDTKTVSLKNVKLIYLSGDYLFLGLNSGKVFWYEYNFKSIKNLIKLKLNNNFELHNSRVSCIYFDEVLKVLYTSSLDNRIFRYDFKLSKDKIEKNYTELVGHEKWIWDMATYTNKENKKMLITADEEGNLLTWFTSSADLLSKINSLFENY